MALTLDSVFLIGEGLKFLIQKSLELEPQSLLCDANSETWRDGEIFNEAIRNVNFYVNIYI